MIRLIFGRGVGREAKTLILAKAGTWGGAEVFLWHLCKELSGRGMPIVIVAPPEGRVLARFLELPLQACYGLDMGMRNSRYAWPRAPENLCWRTSPSNKRPAPSQTDCNHLLLHGLLLRDSVARGPEGGLDLKWRLFSRA